MEEFTSVIFATSYIILRFPPYFEGIVVVSLFAGKIHTNLKKQQPAKFLSCACLLVSK